MNNREVLKQVNFPSEKRRLNTLVEYYRKGREIINNSNTIYFGEYLLDQNLKFLHKLKRNFYKLRNKNKKQENLLENEITRKKHRLLKDVGEGITMDPSVQDYKIKLLNHKLEDLRIFNRLNLENHHYLRQMIKVKSMCDSLTTRKTLEKNS